MKKKRGSEGSGAIFFFTIICAIWTGCAFGPRHGAAVIGYGILLLAAILITGILFEFADRPIQYRNMERTVGRKAKINLVAYMIASAILIYCIFSVRVSDWVMNNLCWPSAADTGCIFVKGKLKCDTTGTTLKRTK
jgi:hydrogenase-4 membrane subunit HyfE